MRFSSRQGSRFFGLRRLAEWRVQLKVVSRPAQKGLFDTLPAEAPMIVFPGTEPSRVLSARTRTANPCTFRSLLRPHTFLLFVLTAALVTWGYADRLTRYKNSPDPLKRTLVARFWVDQQSNPRDAASKLQAPPPSIFDLILPVEAPQPVSHRYAETILCAPRVHRTVAFVRALLPLRSPPSNSFLA